MKMTPKEAIMQLKRHKREIEPISFGILLEKILKNSNTTHQELAEKLSISPKTISHYISDTFKPDIEKVKTISKYLKISSKTLLEAYERSKPGYNNALRKILVKQIIDNKTEIENHPYILKQFEDVPNFGRLIALARKAKHLTSEELAGLLGIAHNTVRCYETNRAKPRYESLNLISLLLDIPIDTLQEKYIEPKN